MLGGVTIINKQRLAIYLTGLLQGIGFRPFIYRLATAHLLTGWVANEDDAVVLEIEGYTTNIESFLKNLHQQIPACGHINSYHQQLIPVINQRDFYFAPSRITTQNNSFICPDIALCNDCINELFDKTNRRYLHPFISCCHCGPRYNVISALPYDRPNTSLADFPLCSQCLAEYNNPHDRRFFAQTIACHDCGPQLSFTDNNGKVFAQKQAALELAVNELKAGKILALKGIGGFQLLVDASNQEAVMRLRQGKHRPSKPFALMVVDLAQAELLCQFNELERHSLCSASAPIVLAKRTNLGLDSVAFAVAPQQALLGIMLPCSGLHHLLLNAMQSPLVATSGNQHDEPICIDNAQAFKALGSLADGFLIHDRAILRPLDDSIVRVLADLPTVLRRARGFVPTPIALKQSLSATLAVGGQQKNTVAIAQGKQVLLSQHLGDLHALATVQQHRATIADLSKLYGFTAQQVVCDKHPDYASSHYAHSLNLPLKPVQHHHAHILSCMAEHGLQAPVLGVAWDGTGLGEDNSLWGGEFLVVCANGFQRVAHCRPFPLVGGTQAIKEPRRVLLGLLYAWQGDNIFTEYTHLLTAFNETELKLLRTLLNKNINCPITSSIGRLFDGLASLLNLCQLSEFEGQAAMAVEQCAMNEITTDYYAMIINTTEPFIMDWQALLSGVLQDLNTLTTAQIAAKIHHSLANSLFAIAEKIALKTLVLSGGCFQNAYLIDAIIKHPLASHYAIYRHKNVPPNDGGLALGQIYAQVIHNE
ncbi:MAG: carbamoyltransferase HypF [Methylococcaceae bacterium]